MGVRDRVEERAVSAFAVDRFRTRRTGRAARRVTMHGRTPRDVGASTVAVIAAIIAVSCAAAVLIIGSIEIVGASEADMPRAARHLLMGVTFTFLVALVAGKLWDRERPPTKGEGGRDRSTRRQDSP